MTLLPIVLSPGYNVLVSVGDKITAGQSLAENNSPTESSEIIINLFKDFGIALKDIESSIKKNLGDSINEGEVIAVRKKMLGNTRILSKISGTIAKIDTSTGEIFIKTVGENLAKKADVIVSPVDGTIDFCNNEKIVIKSDTNAFIAKDASGVDSTGTLLTNESDFDKSENIENKILVKEVADKLFLYKSLSLGAKGVIAKDLQDLDFLDLEGRAMNGAIIVVDEDLFKKLKKLEGKTVVISIENKSIAVL